MEKRREELESFLKVVASHSTLKFDPHLRAFLTLPDFDKYRLDPTSTPLQKVLGYYDALPSVKQLSLTSITDSV